MGAKPAPGARSQSRDLSNFRVSLTEHAPSPMAMVEGAGHIVRYVNPAFCRLIDKPREQLVGKSFGQMLPEQDECVTLLDRVLRTGQPESHTEQQHSKPHPVFWSYTMWPVIKDEHPVGATIQVTETSEFHEKTIALNEALMVGMVRQHELTEAVALANTRLQEEINERKRIEEALRESEERFRALVTATSDAVYRMSPDWSEMRQLDGGNFLLSTEKQSGVWLQEYIHPEDQPHVMAAIHEAIRSRSTFELEHRVRRRDGQWGWTFSRAIPLLDAQGEIVEWFGAASDVTERKRAEEKLRQSEARFSTVFRSGPLAMSINIVSDGRIIDANEQYCKLFGYAREELIGRSVHDFNLWANPEERAPVMQRLLQEGSLRGFEARQRCRSGEIRDVLSSLVLIELADESEPVLISMFADITERKQAEDEVHRLNGELEHRVTQRTAQLQDANQELEAFSYSVSHDLRAPLRHILGFVDLLQQDAGPALSEKSVQHLNTISHAAKRMGHLIDDLLSFSRIGKAEMQLTEVNLDQLVGDTLDDFQTETTERKIEWQIHALPAVWADRALLRLVLVNLISNAVKFTGSRAPPKIEIGCAPGGDSDTVIFIRDNGAGFNPRYASKLFGVFQRLHSQAEFEGTGIGLANVQRIIHRHGGRTWAEGVVDGGAAFYFSIPKPGGGVHGP